MPLWIKRPSCLLEALTKRDDVSFGLLVRQSIFERPNSLSFYQFNGLSSFLTLSRVHEIRSTDDSRSPHACVAVDQYFLASLDKHVHLDANTLDRVGVRKREVLPVTVEVGNSCIGDKFWIVRKTNLVGNEAIATIWVLSRFLQIEDSPDIKVFELCKNVELLDFSI